MGDRPRRALRRDVLPDVRARRRPRQRLRRARRVREDRRRAPAPPRLRHHGRPDPRGAGDGAASRRKASSPSPPASIFSSPSTRSTACPSAPRPPSRAARSSRACRSPRPRRPESDHPRSAGAVRERHAGRPTPSKQRRRATTSCLVTIRLLRHCVTTRSRFEPGSRRTRKAASGDTGGWSISFSSSSMASRSGRSTG